VKSMCVIVPTRGRPDKFAAFLDAWEDTGTEAHLVLRVDDDDPTLPDYQLPQWATVHKGPRIGMTPSLNECAVEYAQRFDIVGHMGDDHHARTLHWDERVAEALDTPGMAFCNDLYQADEYGMPTQVFISSEIIRALGFMSLPGIKHFGDVYWHTLGVMLKRLRYLPDVIIEHMHFGNEKAERDDTYELGGGSHGQLCIDQNLHIQHFESGGMQRDVDRVNRALKVARSRRRRGR